MDNHIVIGIGNKARQGKDTTADYIHGMFPLVSRIYSFARPIKIYCRVAYGMGIKDAKLLQDVGENFRREDPEFWIKQTLLEIYEDPPGIAIIPDMRHINEAAICDIRIKVIRLNPDGTQFIADDRPKDHITEVALDDYDNWTLTLTALSGQPQQLSDQLIESLPIALSLRDLKAHSRRKQLMLPYL